MIDDLSKDATFIPSRTAAFRQIGDEVVIVDTDHNRMVTLNETGSRIWSLLNGQTVQEIADVLETKFQVERETALADTIAFLCELRGRGLVSKKE